MSGNSWKPPVSSARLLAALDAIETPAVPRVPLESPLSRTQMVVAALLSIGHSRPAIAARLGTTENAIKNLVLKGARKIPSSFKAEDRLVAWYRGATRSILGQPKASQSSRADR